MEKLGVELKVIPDKARKFGGKKRRSLNLN